MPQLGRCFWLCTVLLRCGCLPWLSPSSKIHENILHPVLGRNGWVNEDRFNWWPDPSLLIVYHVYGKLCWLTCEWCNCLQKRISGHDLRNNASVQQDRVASQKFFSGHFFSSEIKYCQWASSHLPSASRVLIFSYIFYFSCNKKIV